MTAALLREKTLGTAIRLGPQPREIDWLSPITIAEEHKESAGVEGHSVVAKIFDRRIPDIIKEIITPEGQVQPIELEGILYEIVHTPVGPGPERR